MSRRVGAKKAAEEAAEQIEAQITLGTLNLDKPKPKPTFGEYSQKWLRFVESQCKGNEPKYKQSTYEEYECV